MPLLLDRFRPLQHYRLVEPFVGGMAVALGLNPEKALLNDANPHLINFYINIKNGLNIDAEMKNDREFFLSQRARFNQLVKNGEANSREAAQIFYYMNRTAFNGLCRFNSKGEFNVPFGRYSTINYQRDFSPYSQLLRNWSFTCDDFELLEITTQDFIYLDPPYDVEFTRYSKDDFTWEDQIRLVEWASKLKNPIVASNQATDRIIELYQSHGFTVKTLPAPRRISCTGDRSPAMEMLATRNL